MECLEASAQNELSIRPPNQGQTSMGVRSMAELRGSADAEQKPGWAPSPVCTQAEDQGLPFSMGRSSRFLDVFSL